MAFILQVRVGDAMKLPKIRSIRQDAATVVSKSARWLLLAGLTIAASAASEAARVERTGEQVRLVADGPRPLHAMAYTLSENFGIPVSVEDPLWVHAGDLKDASLENPKLRAGLMVPRGGPLEVEFRDSGHPSTILMAVLAAANRQLTHQYRLDKFGDRFWLVPVRGRDAHGEMAEVTPLLDRLVTIPYGEQTIAQVAHRMAEQLSKQTGRQVSCCQSFVAGIPWGIERITFGADRWRARDVLKYLAGPQRRWVSRCDLHFCFIDFR